MVKKRAKHHKSDSSCQKRRPWTAKEDSAIRSLVLENGVKQWTLIAENLSKKYNIFGRSGKQCRERWHNHLNSGIIKQSWSPFEELTLFASHQQIGNKWAEISKSIPGRTDNSIKNHFYSTIRKFYRRLYNKEGSVEDLKANIKEITDSVLENLKTEREKQSLQETASECYENEQIFPDFSDMVVMGTHINIPTDWCQQDFTFDEVQEVLILNMLPFDLQFF